tara:strand:+ start:77580 stop:78149 length:570 start_codon:yes stop_codon:yes gene_type:complete
MILVIDNYDSFTFNLVQCIGSMKKDIKVVRNLEVKLNEILDWCPTHIVISPGPGRPEEAGITVDVVKRFGGEIPILGVCLGHQAIVLAHGGSIINATKIVHGKTSSIHHNGSNLFDGILTPFTATRYHSLIANEEDLPERLKITAKLEDGTIMGIEHEKFQIFGVQFHPESIATKAGLQIIKNFLGTRL